jgi:hypothetical protein
VIDSKAIAKNVLAILNQKAEFKRSSTATPSEETLSHLIETVFWGSLGQYEGHLIKIKAYFISKEALSIPGVIRLDFPCAVTLDAIRKLSSAHNSDGGILIVESDNSEALIHGLLGNFPSARGVSPFWLCVESRGIGTIRISHSKRPIFEINRGKIKQLGGMTFDRNSAATLLISMGLFRGHSINHFNLGIAHALLDVALEIEETGKGGAIWILSDKFGLNRELDGLGKLIRTSNDWWEPYMEVWEERTLTQQLIQRGIDDDLVYQAVKERDLSRRRALAKTIAGLAGVDGAIVMNGSPDLLAFGVVCNKFINPALTVLRATDPTSLSVGEVVHKDEFGGSRHQSAIDFCSSYHPAGALVASHDGGITVFVSLEKGKVIGSRISMIPSGSDG